MWLEWGGRVEEGRGFLLLCLACVSMCLFVGFGGTEKRRFLYIYINKKEGGWKGGSEHEVHKQTDSIRTTKKRENNNTKCGGRKRKGGFEECVYLIACVCACVYDFIHTHKHTHTHTHAHTHTYTYIHT